MQNPIPIDVLDRALQTAQLVIIELYIARRHSSDLNLLIWIECENLVKLWPVNELQLDPAIFILVCPALSLVVKLPIDRISSIIDSLEEINSQMRGAKRNNESIFQGERHVKADESTRTFSQIPDVVLSVRHVIFDDHVSVAYPIVLVLLDNVVIVDVAFRRWFHST